MAHHPSASVVENDDSAGAVSADVKSVSGRSSARPDSKPVSEVTSTSHRECPRGNSSNGCEGSIGQCLRCGTPENGEQVLCRVAYSSPHQSEKREVGTPILCKPCRILAHFFLHQIGQSEVQGKFFHKIESHFSLLIEVGDIGHSTRT